MNFQYKVRTADGRVLSEQTEAASRDELIQVLEDRGLQPLVVIPAPRQKRKAQSQAEEKKQDPPVERGPRQSIFNRSIGAAVKDTEILMFTRDLYGVVHAGIPLISGIEDIAGQIKNQYFQGVLMQMSREMAAGARFSETLDKHPGVFSEFFRNSIRAGEQAGRLEEVISRLSETIDKDVEMRNTVKDAVRYPIIVICFLILAFIFVTTFTIPRIAGLFVQFNTALPLPTRIIIGVGTFMQQYGLIILGLLTAFGVWFHWYKKTPKGRFLWDRFKLSLPVFGGLFRKVAMSRFANILQTLHSSGVVITQGLRISSKVVDNTVIAEGVMKAYEGVVQGKSLSDALVRTGLFSPLVIRMVMMGERTGNLEGMLGEVVHHYDREILYTAKTLTKMIEPILTVLLGLMVLVFALGVLLPLWQSITLLKQ